ncbi:glycosyltransferase family 4 protein [Marivirga sp. S37H4]|uniref:Glycosyltransferase family 4 protein n=1 Tax=Marivirga aurantiaca TaxID=2802615 RepID=A0A934WX37_9BACT|nr:glycosyltransferase family 4 protein [Marivirga aurantiaca]MBK6264527.1 glycosyltransferase family 4 protein [Marivirga aurantiaca]
MKIIYLSDADFPTRAAHGIHIMKMCESLAVDNEVELISYDYHSSSKSVADKEIFDFYNVKPDFKILKFKWSDFKGSKYLFSFLKAIYAYTRKGDIYYARDFYTALFMVNMGKQVVQEFHHPLKMKRGFLGWLTKRYLKRVKKITVISDALKHQMIETFNLPNNKIIVAHDASVPPATTKKIILGSGNHVGYVGHLYTGKGMEIVVELAKRMTKLQFHVVGGNQDDINFWKEKYRYPNLTYHGFVQQSEISKYINAFDICLLPNQRVVHIWNNSSINISDFTSPLKMFEYMAHTKAIIASDIPVLREVLNEYNAILCNPENLEDWEQAINQLIEDPAKRLSIAEQAYQDFLCTYTWKKRSENILMQING